MTEIRLIQPQRGITRIVPKRSRTDYLTAKRGISEDYLYSIKCRSQKKIARFAGEELRLLIEQGILQNSVRLQKIVRFSMTS